MALTGPYLAVLEAWFDAEYAVFELTHPLPDASHKMPVGQILDLEPVEQFAFWFPEKAPVEKAVGKKYKQEQGNHKPASCYQGSGTSK
jgi:hypothetical protein